jgi:diguanylate cyclase (GGDEF)-like protein
MLRHTVTLAALETYLAALPESRGLAFPAALEKLFRAERTAYWARTAPRFVLRAMVVYDAFLIIDIVFLPHTAWLAAFLRLGVMSPLLVLVGFVIQRWPIFLLQETLSSGLPVLMAVASMLIYRLNSGMAADFYQFGSITILVYGNIHIPTLFRSSLIASAAIVIIFLLAVFTSQSPWAAKMMGSAYMLSVANVTLSGKFRMEHYERRAFLRSLRDRMSREEAQDAANHDQLTGLQNRRFLHDREAELWAQAAQGGGEMAAIMIDVDHFKLFNDRYGHPAGDQCLKRIAGAITAGLRGIGDLAIRYGGEEFLLLLPGLTLAEACQIAERVRRNIEALAIPHAAAQAAAAQAAAAQAGGGIVTASLGVAAGYVATHAADALLAEADVALYEAKRRGRNQVFPQPAENAEVRRLVIR